MADRFSSSSPKRGCILECDQRQKWKKQKQKERGHAYVLRPLSVPMLCANNICTQLHIIPGKMYTVGRSKSSCDVIFEDTRNSMEQMLYCSTCNEEEVSMIKCAKPSANGVYVNGKLMKAGHCRALCGGDEVSFVSHPSLHPTFGPSLGFVVEELAHSVMPALNSVNVSVQQRVNESHEIQEPSVISQSPKSEDLENTGIQDSLDAGFVQKDVVGKYDQGRIAFAHGMSEKNLFIDTKVQSEKGAANVDKPVIDNICEKDSSECADSNGQQKLSMSNCEWFEIEEKRPCTNVTKKNAFSYIKVQEEFTAGNNLNRLSSEAALCPSNEEREKFHENVNIILTGETCLEKQASLKERNIVQEFCPSNDGKMTDRETNVKEVDALLKEIHTEIHEEKTNSGDGKIREEVNDLDMEENGLSKGFSINDPVLTGKSFCLNRLEFMEPNSWRHRGTISLCDLMVPVDSLQGIFCTTFSSDILWFLTYCRVPTHLPVTIVCHNTKRCWSRCDDQRWSKPYPDWPNLTVVYPLFPETIAFCKGPRQGVGCHHSKMFLLYRKESLRLVITSANLGPRQWLHVTNTVWWQDFPFRSTKNFLSLFKSSSFSESKGTVDGDFVAHLAGFIATLISCVPSEAHWVEELTQYDFRKASAYLVASVPGIHGCPHPCPQLPSKFQPGFCQSNKVLFRYESFSVVALKSRGWVLSCRNVRRLGNSSDCHRFCDCNLDPISFSPKSSNCTSTTTNCLGTVPTSVVGLSFHFRAAADPKGERLKALTTLLRSSRPNVDGMIPVLLRRTLNACTDANAISVIVCDINGSSEEFFLEEFSTTHIPRRFLDSNSVNLGFLPKDVAKWIAPLWDAAIFNFAAYVCPHEALETASGRSNNKVNLILDVFMGQNFSQLSAMSICSKHSVFICNLLGSLQRPYGLWRLQEVLSQYKWPNSMETDFIYGSSSIGMSLDARFLAAFAAAAGRKSTSSAASDETDPEWGCWDAEHESEDPSIGIVFPTIERVKSGKDGTLPYSRLLCFAERTWERLKSAKFLHDAIPYPRERVGCPMHTKVARRRFQYCSSKPSFGWIYCGSHNFSPAAWGRPLFKPTDGKAATNAGSVLGSTLHICNYEIGLIFIVPPPEDPDSNSKDCGNLDNITLPFIVPAPRYKESDQPATNKAMHEARIEMMNFQQMNEANGVECLELVTEEALIDEDIPIEDAYEEGVADGGQEEEEEEQVYAETLWKQIDCCQS
ncbi:uncharacterized protein LOC131067524 isoform X2 [Cryptomeria japonica]|uniref:uncharacterized protein LOC131067524 isoform X2 n=1 Tax=Cryptomeria japonica TaxID=3369 RepID=UPI0027DA7B7A|nr:uncharacterized protein LOC131067524 isoform X2 [Cryptomeria japonica]